MNMTIKQAYDIFMLYGAAYWSPKTYKFYEKCLGYFFLYLKEHHFCKPEEFPLQQLRQTILFEYLVFLRSKQRYNNHPLYNNMDVNGAIKASTVNSYMRAVKAFFNYLYNFRYLSIRYTEGLKLPKSDQEQIVVLTAKEVAKIDQTFDLSIPIHLRDYCIVHLMLDAGLRRSEVINLRTKDILFESGAIIINCSKGSKSRVAILCPRLSGVLQKYFEMHKPSGMLFNSISNQKRISDSVINSIFRRIIKLTGIEHLYPHLLRHTFATSYIMGGGNLEMLRILLGHFDYSVTRIYLHLAAQNQILHTDIYQLDPIYFKPHY